MLVVNGLMGKHPCGELSRGEHDVLWQNVLKSRMLISIPETLHWFTLEQCQAKPSPTYFIIMSSIVWCILLQHPTSYQPMLPPAPYLVPAHAATGRHGTRFLQPHTRVFAYKHSFCQHPYQNHPSPQEVSAPSVQWNVT